MTEENCRTDYAAAKFAGRLEKEAAERMLLRKNY